MLLLAKKSNRASLLVLQKSMGMHILSVFEVRPIVLSKVECFVVGTHRISIVLFFAIFTLPHPIWMASDRAFCKRKRRITRSLLLTDRYCAWQIGLVYWLVYFNRYYVWLIAFSVCNSILPSKFRKKGIIEKGNHQAKKGDHQEQ